MAKSKSEQAQEDILKKVRPLKKEGKESKFFPSPDLFHKEKSVKIKDQIRNIRADWRKFTIDGKMIVLFDGQKILQEDYDLIKDKGQDAINYFVKATKAE